MAHMIWGRFQGLIVILTSSDLFWIYFLKNRSYVKISLQISVWKDMSNSYDDIAYVIWTMWYESYHMTKGIIIFINITGGHLYDQNF